MVNVPKLVLDWLDYFSACQNQCVAHYKLSIFPNISIAQLKKLFLIPNLTLIVFSDMSNHTFSLLKHFQLKCQKWSCSPVDCLNERAVKGKFFKKST